MSYLLYDLVIGAVLLLFALRGRKRGLVLALCSLAAVITAFAGGTYAADLLTPKAAELVVPKITSVIERRLGDLDLMEPGASQDAAPAADGGSGAEDSLSSQPEGAGAAEAESDESGISETVREAMKALKLPSGMMNSVGKTLGGLENIRDLPSVLSSAIAHAAADTLLHLIIFLVSFFVILMAWRVFAHALDLVARLPILHFFNKTGGLVLGLCKGIFSLFVLAWILRYLGDIVPADAVEHTYLLRFFMTTDPLNYMAGM